jgi:Protein of unknown function (DUF1761)
MAHFASINWLAVLVAAASGFVIGGLWYGPLFQKPWMKASGMTFERGKQGNQVLIFGGAYVLNLVAAIGIAMLMGGTHGWLLGAHTGLAAGVFFVAAALGVIYLFEQRPLKLFLINAGYQIVNFAAMGAIVGAWPPGN